MPFGLRRHLVRLFARLEGGFLLQAFGIALGLAGHAVGFSAGALEGVVRGAASRGSAPEECAARDHTQEQRGGGSQTRR